MQRRRREAGLTNMSSKQQTHHNHYVPKFYLRRWSSNGNSIWDYRVIVAREHERHWVSTSLRNAATWDDLYTQHIYGMDNDAIEDHLCKDYETPAAAVLRKLDCGQSLSASEHTILADFWFIQLLRTPAYMRKIASKYEDIFEPVMKQAIESTSKRLVNSDGGVIADRSSLEITERPFPLQPIEIELDRDSREVTVRTSVGRSGYLATVGSLLNGPVRERVRSCTWSIIRAPIGSHFYTSDNPAVVFGLSSDGSVMTDGLGLGQHNVNLVLPLDTDRVLFTQVGSLSLGYPSTFTKTQVGHINEAICKSAFRHIYSKEKDDSVRRIRPRVVDADLVNDEKDFRNCWNTDQAALEREHEQWLIRNVRRTSSL